MSDVTAVQNNLKDGRSGRQNAGQSFLKTTPATAWLQRAWSELDPTGSGFIQVWQLRQLVMEVGSPLGFRRPPARWWRLIRWVGGEWGDDMN